MESKTDKKHVKAAKPEEKPPGEKQPAGQAGELIPPAPLTPSQIEQLKEQAAKAGEYRDRLLREAADFENYRKRAARERQEAVTYANEALLQKLLPVLDSFEMALATTTSGGSSAQSLQTGVLMVHNQLKSTLADAGLEEIDARGKVFDPNLHEAVSQQESAEVPEGNVLQQIRKGYKFRNRLVRAAGVIVARKPAAA
jgi:molecular chaperone GrpE